MLLLATPAQAHCYSRWYYPQPQHCDALTKSKTVQSPKQISILPPERNADILLPGLDWLDCPVGDERLEGIAKLRALNDGL